MSLNSIDNQKKKPGQKPRVSLILTGGTIGAKKDLANNVLFEVTEKYLYNTILTDLLKNEIDCDIYLAKTNLCKLSENMIPEDWKLIATSIKNEIDRGVDGIVVTHGTDTLAYSTSAVSFMLGSVPIPVVFTGAFIPLSEPNTDAIKNIRNSIQFSITSKLPGIFALFGNQKNNGYVFRGTQITSVNPYGLSFFNPNFKIAASIISEPFSIEYFNEKITSQNRDWIKFELDPNVAFFKVHPGFNPKIIEMAIKNGSKGIILELYHSSTACTLSKSQYSLTSIIEKNTKKGILFFGHPGIDASNEIYRTTKELKEAGVIMLKKMTLESAIVKLMWLLANYPEVIETKMQENVIGEFFD